MIPRPPIREPIDPHLKEAVRFAAANELVPPTTLEVSAVVWGGKPAPWIERLEIDPSGELRLEAEPPVGAVFQDDPSRWTPSLFVADAEGGHLAIESASCDVADTVDSVIERARLEGFVWRALDPHSFSKVRLWATELQFITADVPWPLRFPRGNVFFQVSANRTCHAWRFQSPEGLVFMIPSGDRRAWRLAFEARGGAPPTEDHVVRVIAVLSFTFGIPFRIGVLQAVGENGIQRGLVHLGLADLRPLREPSERPAVPIENVVHLVDFVELALRFMVRENASALLAAFHLHGASYEGFVDTQFLMAWIAAETVATWAIDNKKMRPPGQRRIADTTKWRSWVRLHKKEIKELAEPGYEVSLYDKIFYSDYQTPSSVQRVFRDQGLWNDAMNEVEQVRNLVAHEGLMCGRNPRDWRRDLALVTLAQTLVTAVIAILVGYDGPILDRGDHRGKVPKWWRMSEWPPIAVIYDSLDKSDSEAAG